MNKYQEALDYINSVVIVGMRSGKTKLRKSKYLLQELVDKETPMKPYRNKRYCGKCDVVRLLPEVNYYCSNCGQKIDWGDTD